MKVSLMNALPYLNLHPSLCLGQAYLVHSPRALIAVEDTLTIGRLIKHQAGASARANSGASRPDKRYFSYRFAAGEVRAEIRSPGRAITPTGMFSMIHCQRCQ